MRIGIGLPAAVPGVDGTTIGAWAAEAERAGFASVGVIDRLVYDNLEPLTAPRIATGRYFSLGLNADVIADNYIRHYYGDAGFAVARADTLTRPDQIHHELDHLAKEGVTDLVLYPSSSDPDQVPLLVEAVCPWLSARRPA